MRTLIAGLGANDCFVCSRFIRAGAGVSFFGRLQRSSEIERHGLLVDSSDGNFRAAVHTLRYEQLAPVDLIVLSTRSHMSSLALAGVRPAIGPSTVLLPLCFN